MKLNSKFIALLLATTVLTGCGGNGGKKDTKAPNLVSSLVATEVGTSASAPGSVVSIVKQINLFEENLYQYIQTEVTYGFSMVLGNTSIVTYGTYEAGEAEDGITQYTLNSASEVLFNSYSKAGGYHISINTQDQTYPTELLASGEGEKNMANSKDDVINEYGQGFVAYGDGISFTYSKDGDGAKETVTTKSGSVDKLLSKKVKSVNLVGTRTDMSAIYAGGYSADVFQVTLFEDNTYETIKTSFTFGFSMIMGVSSIITQGAAELGTETDGVSALTLKQADRVIMHFFSAPGGGKLHIDTDNCTYPAEMIASGEGDKNMANSKEDVIAEYGLEKTVYIPSDNNELSLTDPNA